MAEDVGDVGGKALIQVASLECNLVHLQVLFIITQSIAIACGHPAVGMQLALMMLLRYACRQQRSMSSSRRFAELAEVKLQEFQLEITMSMLYSALTRGEGGGEQLSHGRVWLHRCSAVLRMLLCSWLCPCPGPEVDKAQKWWGQQ